MQVGVKTTPHRLLTLVSSRSKIKGEERYFSLQDVFEKGYIS